MPLPQQGCLFCTGLCLQEMEAESSMDRPTDGTAPSRTLKENLSQQWVRRGIPLLPRLLVCCPGIWAELGILDCVYDDFEG